MQGTILSAANNFSAGYIQISISRRAQITLSDPVEPRKDPQEVFNSLRVTSETAT